MFFWVGATSGCLGKLGINDVTLILNTPSFLGERHIEKILPLTRFNLGDDYPTIHGNYDISFFIFNYEVGIITITINFSGIDIRLT